MLVIKGVSKVFQDTDKETLQNINLDIEEGEFICIVGPSGSGKSTLLNLIAGLDKPTEGEILLDGLKVVEPGIERTVMFQEAALFPWLSVIENVKFGMNIAKIPKEEQENKAIKYLEMVHLSKYKDYAVHQLSGGMKQRAALARALTMDGKLLLMDEPFSSLDKQTTNILRDEVEKIWEVNRKTIILVTHSVEEAIFFADRIFLLSSNPGSIKKIYEVNLPRPRHIESREFVNLRKEILGEVREEVEKIAQKEYE